MRQTKSFYLFGLIMSKLLILAIDLPIMIWGLTMVHEAATLSFLEFMGAAITLASGVLYVILNMKCLVEWAVDIDDFILRMFPQKEFSA